MAEAHWADRWIAEREQREFERKIDSALARLRAKHAGWFDCLLGVQLEMRVRPVKASATVHEIEDELERAYKTCRLPGWTFELTSDGRTIIRRPGGRYEKVEERA